MDHLSSCRLTEVPSRLAVVQAACPWPELTPAEAIPSVDRLAGWAAVHLGVVIERGCDCSPSIGGGRLSASRKHKKGASRYRLAETLRAADRATAIVVGIQGDDLVMKGEVERTGWRWSA